MERSKEERRGDSQKLHLCILKKNNKAGKKGRNVLCLRDPKAFVGQHRALIIVGNF
jgi:hypothetical protein